MSDFETVPLGTLAKLNRLERVNREREELLDQVYQYVDEQGLAKLGQSRAMALIEAHRQVAAELNRLEAAERERDRIQTESAERILRLEGVLIKYEQREQALAAHVGHQHEWLARAERKLSAYVGICNGDKELNDTVLPMVRQTLEASPTTSLARRDTEQLLALADALEQAEAPDAEGGDMWDARQCADWIREQAELRRQAEGGECPGHGKCDDPGCPAHYAAGDE